jgi:hypothetical protein
MPGETRLHEHPIFLELNETLARLAAAASLRQGGIEEQALKQAENWAAWQSQWLTDASRIGESVQSLRTAESRAGELVKQADNELSASEQSLRDWLEIARRLNAPSRP